MIHKNTDAIIYEDCTVLYLNRDYVWNDKRGTEIEYISWVITTSTFKDQVNNEGTGNRLQKSIIYDTTYARNKEHKKTLETTYTFAPRGK
jgi:hypothetical protein